MADSQLPQRWIPSAPPLKAGAGSSAQSEEESILRSLMQSVALIRRHWLLVLGIAATSVLVLLYRIRNEPHIYRATATIRLEDKARELSNGIARPGAQVYRPFNDPVLTQLQVLQSQAVAESVAEREGLRLRALPRRLPPTG